MIGYTYVQERKVLEIKMKNLDKLQEQTFDKLFYDCLGLTHFAIAFSQTDRIKSIDISENDIGSTNFIILLPIFKSNNLIETVNVADTTIDGECAKQLCGILKELNFALKILQFRNSNLSDVGAEAISNLIAGHQTLVELEIFNCGIGEQGGNAIGNALKTNFCIEKLCIGDNILAQADCEQI